MCDSYYTILGVNESASFEEIKNSYQELIKLYHPDKQMEDASTEKFIKVNEAWNVLRDEKLRKEYDSTLFQHNLREVPLIYAELKVNQLDFKEGICYYPCRCGNFFQINKTEVNEDCLLECLECSNFISVKI